MEISEQIVLCKGLKKELKLTNQDVANGSGVPLGTVNRFFGNKTTDFRYDSTVKPIYDYLTNMKEPVLSHKEKMLNSELSFARLLIKEKEEHISKSEKTIQTLKNIIVSLILLSLILFSVLLTQMGMSITYTVIIGICMVMVVVAWLLSLGVKRKCD